MGNIDYIRLKVQVQWLVHCIEVVPAVWTTTKPIQAIPLVEKQLPIVTKPKNYEDGGMWL